jgi:hypothetical protein
LGNDGGSRFALLCGFSNAVEASADGWTVIPFGEWPHAEGIQIFGQQEATTIVENFKKGWSRFKRAVVGLPVFKGHPDIADTFRPEIARETNPGAKQALIRKMQSFANAYPDKKEYGQIADMEVRPEGLAIKQVLSAAGAALVNSGLKFISPHWGAMPVGERNGKILWAPRDIRSVGLTDLPNIPNKSLVNTAHAGTSKTMTPEQLLALIAILGLANDATVEQITAAVTERNARPTAEALANEKAQTIAATQRATTAETALATVTTERNTAATALANVRSKAIDELLVAGVKGGKITEADKGIWKKRLEHDFEGESVALANSQAMKTTPTAEQKRLAAADARLKQNLGNEHTEGGGAGGAKPNISALVNAEMQSDGCKGIANTSARYNKAFANVKARHPDLFKPAEVAAS